MKLVSVGIDPDRAGWPRYGADTIPLSRWEMPFVNYFIMWYWKRNRKYF